MTDDELLRAFVASRDEEAFRGIVGRYVDVVSNYLYRDGHVGTVLPRDGLTGIDPWDLRTTSSPPQ